MYQKSKDDDNSEGVTKRVEGGRERERDRETERQTKPGLVHLWE